MTEIAIERWSTKAERTKLLEFVETAKYGEGGQRKLLNALQKVKPRAGFIRTPNSIGWDLRYAVENTLQDGTRQLVICTDKPVSFAAAASDSRAMDYPFTLIEMRFAKPGEKGEGKMLAATSIMVKNGRLELENYGQEPVRLTEITEQEKEEVVVAFALGLVLFAIGRLIEPIAQGQRLGSNRSNGGVRMKLRRDRLGRLMACSLTVVAIAYGQVASAQETKIEGLITSRNGAQMTVKGATGDFVITLTDATEVKEKEGRLGLRKKQAAVMGLIPGLKVDVHGMADRRVG